MKAFRFSLGLLSLISLFLGCGGTSSSSRTEATTRNEYLRTLDQAFIKGTNPTRYELISLGIGDATYEVEVAGQGVGSNLGLMFRKQLGPDEGMWFEFPEEDFLKFWMKDTSLPLSIAFVDKSGVITNIEDLIPFNETSVLSRSRACYALEMNRGWFKNKGIQAGDMIRIGRKRIHPFYQSGG